MFVAWRGEAWQGVARQGKAGSGKARQGYFMFAQEALNEIR